MPFIEESKLSGLWKQPKPEFHQGQYVIYEEQVYKVKAASHAHVQLEELPLAVSAWQCKSQWYAIKIKASERQSKPSRIPLSVKTEQEGISA